VLHLPRETTFVKPRQKPIYNYFFVYSAFEEFYTLQPELSTPTKNTKNQTNLKKQFKSTSYINTIIFLSTRRENKLVII